MAIIRNERSPHRDPQPQEQPEVEEEIDYSWHPTEEEFVSPLTAEQWAELLGDASFTETDAARAVVCLRDYGEPATFQQLSIRYRGTMGRYRRWLSEAAQVAGERFGASAPQRDQFGMEEWWPLLYLTRATGKPGAGVFEMMLRPEVEEAFELLAEKERQEKRAENARNLLRIEKLERARKEERERKAAEASKTAEQEAREAATADEAKHVEASRAQPQGAVHDAGVRVPSHEGNPASDVAVGTAPASPRESRAVKLSALRAFLELEKEDVATGSRFVQAPLPPREVKVDEAAPLDYALRYAERLRHALALMREGDAYITAAQIARLAGEDSVESLQQVLNGQAIPGFDLLDRLERKLFVATRRLEAPDGIEASLPTFATLGEARGAEGVVACMAQERVAEICYVVDDANDRRTGVIVRFSTGACALLARIVVNGAEKRDQSPVLDAFINMVDELDDLCRERGIARTSRQVGEKDCDALFAGELWPGTLLER